MQICSESGQEHGLVDFVDNCVRLKYSSCHSPGHLCCVHVHSLFWKQWLCTSDDYFHHLCVEDIKTLDVWMEPKNSNFGCVFLCLQYVSIYNLHFIAGLRVSVLITVALMFAGTGLRCITSKPAPATW